MIVLFLLYSGTGLSPTNNPVTKVPATMSAKTKLLAKGDRTSVVRSFQNSFKEDATLSKKRGGIYSFLHREGSEKTDLSNSLRDVDKLAKDAGGKSNIGLQPDRFK